MSDNKNKKLVNLIKADLQDFLNNEKRLEKGWYFFPYDDMSGKIWVIKDRGKGFIISSEIENLVREIARVNASCRQEKHEKLWAEETEKYKKRGIILPNKKFKLDEREIWQEELEKEDYDEIVNLIKQVNQARDINEKSQRKERKEKRDLEPKGKNGCDTCHKKLGRDWGGSDNFYIIKRYHGEVNIGGPVIWACPDCYSVKEQEYLKNYETVWERYLDKDGSADYRQIKFSFIDCYAGKKDQNGKVLQQQNCPHCWPWKQHQNLSVSEIDVKSLIQYLQKYSIKEITFKTGELFITHNNNNNNNNETVSAEKIDDKQELVLVRNIFQKTNQTKLTKEDLEKMLNANPTSTKKPKSDNALWVGCVIGGILIIGVVVGLVVSKKRKNK